MQPKTWLKSFNSFVLNISYDELGTKNKYKKEKGEGGRKEEGPLAQPRARHISGLGNVFHILD